MTFKFKLSLDLLTMHLLTEFHHLMFSRSEVIVLTNKEILLKASTSLRYATPVKNDQ